MDNLKTDLMRRVKMLEYALRQERCVSNRGKSLDVVEILTLSRAIFFPDLSIWHQVARCMQGHQARREESMPARLHHFKVSRRQPRAAGGARRRTAVIPKPVQAKSPRISDRSPRAL